MINCKKCGMELEDGSRFCDSCGEALEMTDSEKIISENPDAGSSAGLTNNKDEHGEELNDKPETIQEKEEKEEKEDKEDKEDKEEKMVYCCNCGSRIPESSAFCDNCGASTSVIISEPEAPETPVNGEKTGKKKIIIPCAVAAAVLAAGTGVFLLSGHKSMADDTAMYIKDNDIYMSSFSADKPSRLSSSLRDNTGYSVYSVNSMCKISKDGKIVLYPDRARDYSASLYYRFPEDESDPVKVDSDVTEYFLSDSGNIVTYLKESENTLYQYNIGLQEKNKLGRNVYSLKVSDDGNRIYYTNYDNELHILEGDNEEKIRNVDWIVDVSDDYKTVYYMANRCLYVKTEGAEKEKISSLVSNAFYSSDGKVYYFKEAELKIKDYIEDDMAEEDAETDVPEEPVFPAMEKGQSEDDYNKAVDIYYEKLSEYYLKIDAAEAKQERDNIRKYKSSLNYNYGSVYSLCCYDGEKEQIIFDGNVLGYDISNESETALIYVNTLDISEFNKIPLSSIDYSDYQRDASSKIYKEFENCSKSFFVVGTDSYEFDNDGIFNRAVYFAHFKIDKSGSNIYVQVNPGDGEVGRVFSIKLNGTGVSKSELISSDTCSSVINAVTSDGSVLFHESEGGPERDLFLNKKLIGSDINYNSARYDDKTNTVTFICDWDDDEKIGTLKCYDFKEIKKIADDVSDYVILKNGDIEYLRDYSEKYEEGDVYIFHDNESKLIDTDASELINFQKYN